MGGTFDHLHLGHRLLLSQAAILTKTTLNCGVTSESLLSSKSYKEYLEPLHVRIDSVTSFLRAFNPKLKVNIFELTDTAGVGGIYPEI